MPFFATQKQITKRERWLLKIGDWPNSWEPLPDDLLELAGKAGGLPIKGYEAEKAGLGIGASIYYRRVVDDMAESLINRVLKYARLSEADEAIIERLEKAREEDSFKRKMTYLGDMIPPQLFTRRKNPLSILVQARKRERAFVHGPRMPCARGRGEDDAHLLRAQTERPDRGGKDDPRRLARADKATTKPPTANGNPRTRQIPDPSHSEGHSHDE